MALWRKEIDSTISVRACILGSPVRRGHLWSGVLVGGLAADPLFSAVGHVGRC